jgi:cytolysin (calcineurin-like family phosphatase)
MEQRILTLEVAMTLERNESATHYFLTASQLIRHIVATMIVLPLLLLLLVQASSNAQVPSNYELCAKEGERCQFTGTRTVRYGANGIWAEQTATNGITCGVAAFGRDPVPNVLKQCYIVAPVQASDFYMIFAADTQYPWTDVWKRDANGNKVMKKNSNGKEEGIRVPETRAESEIYSEKLNRDYIKGMQSNARQIGNANLRGVIINGDLTNFGQPGELDKYKEMWEQTGLKIYPGLGNHDYANNVNDCFENRCATGMVKYLNNFMTKLNPASYDFQVSGQYHKFPENRVDYKGSMAYSWDISDVHFVQLHNYPAYTRSWNAWDAGAARRDFIEITSSLNWLRADLTKARNEGKKIILNMHDVSDHFPDEHQAEYSQFVRMVGEFKVSAIFAGHIHEYHGQRFAINGAPVFYSGSTSHSAYLLAHFQGDKLIVEKVSSVGGVVIRTPANKNDKTYLEMREGNPVPLVIGTPNLNPGENIYSLNSDRPAAPMAVANATRPRSITFNNQAGYVAKMTVVYFVTQNINGTQVPIAKTVVTPTLSLGLSNTVEIPRALAKGMPISLQIDGIGTTAGKVFATTVPEGFNGNLCFKSWGTIFDAKGGPCQ